MTPLHLTKSDDEPTSLTPVRIWGERPAFGDREHRWSGAPGAGRHLGRQMPHHQWGADAAAAGRGASAGALAWPNEGSGAAVGPARAMAWAARQLGRSRPPRAAALAVMRTRRPTPACVALVGLDGADTAPAVWLQAAGAEIRDCRVGAHTPEALGAGAGRRRHRGRGRPSAVCLAGSVRADHVTRMVCNASS
jgi:hypothetical protein